MCFNETVSLIVFLGAITVGLKLYNNNEINAGLFIMTISIMQIAEYFVHRSIRLNNKQMLKYGSYMVYIILFIQPLLHALIHYKYPNANYMFKQNRPPDRCTACRRPPQNPSLNRCKRNQSIVLHKTIFFLG